MNETTGGRAVMRVGASGAVLASLFLAGCITLSYGQMGADEQEFLKIQSHCRDVARAETAGEKPDIAAYQRAYDQCVGRLGRN